jgi:hypothetical protein
VVLNGRTLQLLLLRIFAFSPVFDAGVSTQSNSAGDPQW